MNDADWQANASPWVCPWRICDHEQAQACRASRGGGERLRSCGTYFAVDVTPEQARQIVKFNTGSTS